MQISAVRTGLADAARLVVLPTGTLTSTSYQPDVVTEPHFFVGEYTVDFDKTFGRGLDEVEFTCAVLVSRADDRASQSLIDAMLSSAGPASLKKAIEAARGAPGALALGGAADDLHLMRVMGYRWYDFAGAKYLGAELIIRVIGDGRT